MTTKEHILEALWERNGDFVSGQELAGGLGISRTAVWKAVEQLRAQGHEIESVPHRGYCLISGDRVLTETAIRGFMLHSLPRLLVCETVTSTNALLRQMAEEGAEEGTVVVAGAQTAGRGRAGRSFFSPDGTGVYFSLLVRPSFGTREAGKLTVCAAAAAAETIETLTGRKTQIKWVNDILVDGRKVCGILTEGAMDLEAGGLSYAVVGIGINIDAPAGGFPREIAGRAGAIRKKDSQEDLRCRLAAGVIDRFLDSYEALPEITFREAYESRLAMLGKAITVLPWGGEPREAVALSLTEDFALAVVYPDGTEEILNSGEISIREMQEK